MTKIRYSAIDQSVYVWHVVTNHGTVIVGEVFKQGPHAWRAVITHHDGEALRTPWGGVYSGHHRTRALAVERALFPLLDAAQHHLNLMNT